MKNDLGLLKQAKIHLNTVLKSSKVSASVTKDNLIAIAENISSLAWGENDAALIRNRFGKLNYSKNGIENKSFIDFQIIARLKALLADNTISDIFIDYIDENYEHLNTLRENISTVINAIETNTEPPVDLKPITPLYNGIDFFCDMISVKYLSETLADAIKFAETPLSQVALRYGAARIITILGETFKNLSKGFKAEYPYLNAKKISKMRDLIAHSHRRLVKTAEAITQNYQTFLKNDIVNLTSYIISTNKSLQEKLKRLSSAENKTAALSTIFKTREDKLASFTMQASVNIDFNKQNSMDPMDFLLLCQLRLCFIRKTLNKTNSFSSNTTSKLDKKLQKAQSNLNGLETKQTGGTLLTPSELKKLQNLKKTIIFLKNKIKTKQSAIKNNAEPVTINSSIPNEEKTQLLNITEASNICSLYSKLKQKNSPIKTTRSQPTKNTKIEYLLSTLIEEKKLAIELSKTKTASKRNYASELSIAAIGQIFRDIEHENDSVFNTLSNDFTTPRLKNCIRERNESLMHSPLEINTAKLSDHIYSNIDTTLTDDEAIAELTKAANSEVPHAYSSADYAAKLQNYAISFSRLGYLDEALLLAKSSLEFLSDENILKEAGISFQQPYRLFFLDNETSIRRYTVRHTIANILLAMRNREVRDPEALTHLQAAYDIFQKHPNITSESKFNWHGILEYIVLKARLTGARLSVFEEKIVQLRDHIDNNYLQIRLAASEQTPEQGLQRLEKVKENTLKGENQLRYYLSMLNAYAAILEKSQNMEIVSTAISYAEKCNNILHSNEFYKRFGTHHEKQHLKKFKDSLVQFIRAFEHCFLNFSTDIPMNTITDTKSRALKVSEMNDIDTTFLTFNYGSYCGKKLSTLAHKSSLSQQEHTEYKTEAIRALTKTIIKQSNKELIARAYFELSILYENSGNYERSLSKSLEGLSFFSMLPSAEKSKFDSDHEGEILDVLKNAAESINQSKPELIEKHASNALNELNNAKAEKNFPKALQSAIKIKLLLPYLSGAAKKRLAPGSKKKSWLSKHIKSEIETLKLIPTPEQIDTNSKTTSPAEVATKIRQQHLFSFHGIWETQPTNQETKPTPSSSNTNHTSGPSPKP